MSMGSARDGCATVYVVDDDERLRPALRRMLEGAGFDVQAYADGKPFLAAVTPDSRGCLVIDQALPGMTGLQVLEQMRQRGLRLPFILLTGSGNRVIESKAKALGAFAYLEKPINGERLIDCIRQALASDG